MFNFHRSSEQEKGVKLVLSVFEKIINNPMEISKYGNLNYNKINNKLSNCKPGLKLLLLAGFTVKHLNQDDDKPRLIFENTKENMIKMINICKILRMNEDSINTYICLIKEGYTNKQAIEAINLSTED